MLDLGSAVGYLLLDTSGFESGFKSAMSGFKTFANQSKSFDDRITGLGKGLTTVGGAMTTGLTLPILGAGSAMLYAANDFETALKNIQSNTGATEKDMDKFKQVLDDIYKNNYGENYQDIAEAISEVDKQLGNLSDEELQEVTESAFALRDTFGYEVNESVRAASTLMQNFGIDSKEAFDLITEGAQNGLDFSGEFVDSINEYSVQFKKLGFTAEDMFYVLQQGAENGAWNLDKVGDAMKELSIRVIDGSDTTVASFEAIGLNADEMAQKFAAGGEEAKQALKETADALFAIEDPVRQNAIGVGLFGTMWEDLGPEVVKQISDITNATYDASGAMDELKNAKYDTLGNDIESLKREFVSLGKDLGVILIPIFRDIVQWISDFVSKFSEMSEGTQKVILAVGGIIAAIGPLLTIFGNIMTIIPKITALFSGASGLSGAIAALSGPIGIIIAAIAALAVAWNTNLGGIQEKTQQVLESISSIISSILDIIKGLWENNFLGVQDIVKQGWEFIEGIFSDAFDLIVGIFEVFDLIFQGKWREAFDKLINLLKDFVTNFISRTGDWLNLIVDSIIRIGVRLFEAGSYIFNQFWQAVQQIWNNFMSWLNWAKNNPVDAILSIGSALWNAGASIFNSLWDGIMWVWDGISSWVENAVDWIVSKVAFWQSESAKVSSGGYSHAQGIDYVPYDGYPAILHKGERVLTQEENRNGVASGTGGSVRVEIPLYMNSREVARATVKDLNKELGKLR